MEKAISYEQKRYGTFYGVFLPSILSIFGVIMYLRVGMILGHIGLAPTLSIICLSSLITLIAAFSISAVATNMVVNKGGTYYIISRSLGIDFGSAVGIPLYLAQAIGIAFYLMGFSESVAGLLPEYDPKMISFAALGVLGLLGFFSTSFVLKTQFFIFLAILASLASIFLGHNTVEATPLFFAEGKLTYWMAFAIFFPAVTGIQAGISMSGVLKQPSRSIPQGSLAAVVVGLVVYLFLALFLWFQVPQSALASDMMVCESIAKWGVLVLVGIGAATLSSALGSIVSAPRTLQAIAEDRIVPRFLGKEFGKNREPRIATLFTLGLSAVFVFFGNIDLIAPILTMFFLISYCMLNLVAGLETVMGSPSWRPTFPVPAVVSFGGAVLCLIAMLMINAGATMVSFCIVFAIYVFRGKKLSSNWDDMCFGILMLFIKTTVYRLQSAVFASRNWRPHLLVFSPSLTPHAFLLDFTAQFTQGHSFLTFANIVAKNSLYKRETVEKTLKTVLKKRKLKAFVDVDQVDQVIEGYKRLIMTNGMGPLTHNTIVLMHSESQAYELHPQVIKESYNSGKNVIVLRADSEMGEAKIDVWWDSENKSTSELILVIAHMYHKAKGRKKSQITIKTIVSDERARQQRLDYFTEFFSKSRLNVGFQIYVGQEEEEFKLISHFSEEADLTFVPLPTPSDGDYQEVYGEHLKSLKSLKRVAYILAAEPVNFQEIFR